MLMRRNTCLWDVAHLVLWLLRSSILGIWALKVSLLVMSFLLGSSFITYCLGLLFSRARSITRFWPRIGHVILPLLKSAILKYHLLLLICWSKCLKETPKVVSVLRLLWSIPFSTTRWTWRCHWRRWKLLCMKQNIHQGNDRRWRHQPKSAR